MKLKTQDLIEALNHLKPVISRRATLPILSCVKIHAERNRLHLTASDLDQYQVEKIECDGELEPFCVNFSFLVNALGGEFTILKQTKNTLTVSCSFGTTELDILDAAEFPPLPKCEGLKNIGVSCEDLAEGINSVAWAASVDPSRWNLQSVHVVGAVKNLHTEAISGRELAVFDRAIISSGFEAVIPSGMVPGASETLRRKGSEFSLCDSYIKVSHEFGSYYAKQVDTKYPNTKNAIPAKTKLVGEVQIVPLLDIFSRCNFFSNPQMPPLAVTEFSNDGMTVQFTGKNSNLAMKLAGKFSKASFRLSAESFLKCLRAVKTETAKLSIGEDGSPYPVLLLQSGDLFIYTTQIPAK